MSILRNAGGRVTDDVLDSLELISTVGGVGMVAIVHHTGWLLGSYKVKAETWQIAVACTQPTTRSAISCLLDLRSIRSPSRRKIGLRFRGT